MSKLQRLTAPDSRYVVCPIRGLLGYFHLLYDKSSSEAALIDTGLVGEKQRLLRALQSVGLGWRDIRAILLTHGHLDHTGNLARLKQLTGAPIFAHSAEQAHIDGRFPYRGASHICGVMEAFGRALLRYRPTVIDEFLHDGMELPFWGGLRVVHLPGHTQGHCGFLSLKCELLFTGDLFASYGVMVHLPPMILNSCPEYFDASLQRVRQISPRRIVPNHYFGFDSELHRQRFEALLARRDRRVRTE